MRGKGLLHASEQCLVLVNGMSCAEIDGTVGVLSQDAFNGMGLEGFPISVQTPESVSGVP